MSTIKYKEVDTYEAMSQAAASLIIETVKHNPEAILCLAGGDTPLGTFKCLVASQKEGLVDFSKATFIGLDEWVGLNGDDVGSCRKYLNDDLFSLLGIQEKNILFFDGKADDINQECVKVNAFLKAHGPLDVCLLGVGVNGHLGFNEPFSDISATAHIVDLDDSTKEVGKKYFNGKSTTTQGVTLGLKQLLESKMVIVVASGATKKDAIASLKSGTYHPAKTVSVLNGHPCCYAILNQI